MSINWNPNLGTPGSIGTDLERLTPYYLERFDASPHGTAVLLLWEEGSSPEPALMWYVQTNVAEFAETVADILRRHGLTAAVEEQRFPLPPFQPTRAT